MFNHKGSNNILELQKKDVKLLMEVVHFMGVQEIQQETLFMLLIPSSLHQFTKSISTECFICKNKLSQNELKFELQTRAAQKTFFIKKVRKMKKETKSHFPVLLNSV